MPTRTSATGSELFIVDNSDELWKVRQYLQEWCQISKGIDIATAYFEIGSLLALDSEWQKVDQFRILMGDEVSLRTRRAFESSLKVTKSRLDLSLESEKQKDDFLPGLPAIVDGIRSGKIQCRVYRKDKFHAKTFITHARLEVVGSSALVGSSNLTYPGLTENIELNVQITGGPVTVLQEWFEEHWERAEDVSTDILRVIERHAADWTPFEVYAKALQEYFRNAAETDLRWESAASQIFPVLDKYQQDGYHNLLQIADRCGGALLCDGVGLGKTFIGLMLIERLVVHERKNVVLLAPKATLDSVWRPAIRRYLPALSGRAFNNLFLLAHTDLLLEKQAEEIAVARARAHAVVIDEAHHFRNPGRTGRLSADPTAPRDAGGQIAPSGATGPSRYRKLFDMIETGDGRPPKSVYMLTATPINNRLDDLRHLIELFSRGQPDHFKDWLGIHNLRAHFLRMEGQLDRLVGLDEKDGQPITDLEEAREVLAGDRLVRSVVVQRSRAFVRAQQDALGLAATPFPKRADPVVAEYSLKKVYGRLLESVSAAFSKQQPLFSLAAYYPLAFYRGADAAVDPFEQNRQRQVVGLIRTGFLKRFESSVTAFERSCERLLKKLSDWVVAHATTASEKRQVEQWKGRHAKLLQSIAARQSELFGDDDDEATEDLFDEEMLEEVDRLSRDEYDVPAILGETMQDLDQIAEFLGHLRQFTPSHDDKLKKLVELLTSDPALAGQRVLIFSEFADTARYLEEQLTKAGVGGLERIDSGTKGKNREDVIKRFSPYYNGTSSSALAAQEKHEIRVLISTDVLSEGLNLQDATRLINYDLHWNPVRLMQRIGRVDRRLNLQTEATLVADHPEAAATRGSVAFWNFLPPAELNELLTLYSKVTHKTLRISKTLGIEGRKLLRHDDKYEDLRHFNETYEGTPSAEEAMRLELDTLLGSDTTLEARLKALPGKVFSGKRHPSEGSRAVFLCFRLPVRETPSPGGVSESDNAAREAWSTSDGPCRWYLYDLAEASEILEEASRILEFIRSKPDTPRRFELARPLLSEIRRKVEIHIKNTYLKQLNAPVMAPKPALLCWMELNEG